MVELVKYDSDQRDKLKKNIKELLSERGLSRKEFAEKLGYAESTINYWIRGERIPDKFSLEALCDFFDVDDVSLLGSPMKIRTFAYYKRDTLTAFGTMREIEDE